MHKIQYKTKNLTVFESELFRTTSTLIETADLLLLVDPNWLPSEIENLQLTIKRKQGGKPLFLLFTHSDYDHIIGYRAFENAQIIASQAFVNNENKANILKQINDWDDENYIKRNYLIEYPTVDIVIKTDVQQLQVGATTLTFYLAPGHNRDGIFTIIEPLGIWIAGDYLSNIEFPYIYHSSKAYEATLSKVQPILANHAPKILITGHGDVALTSKEILQRQTDSYAYIEALRAAIQENESFDFARLMEQYDFPKIMKEFHDGNIALLKRELGKVEE
ncbi:MAG: MBL fold metallo-hydrolase [Saprospiraceae bacterium]